MSSALQIAHTDLTGAQKVSATNAVQPAKRSRDYSTQSKAMKMAWDGIRKWMAYSGKPMSASHRGKFISRAFAKLRMAKREQSSVYITPEEAQFIGSDCLMKMREVA